MAPNGSSSFVEFSLRLLLYIADLANSVSKVLILKDQFQSFAKMVDRLKPVLHELKDNNGQSFSESIKDALSKLEGVITKALVLSHSCQSGSICLLLLKSPDTLRKIEILSKEISSCLDALSLTNLEFSTDTNERIIELRDIMQHAEFKAAVETEDIIVKLQGACQEEHMNSQSVMEMLVEIAKVTGSQTGSSFVAREIEAVKKQKVELEEQKERNEVHILEQIIAFLNNSDMVSCRSKERVQLYSNLPYQEAPMRAFCCPLTGTVMEDPVDISSGYTFERSAIQDWFDEGKKTCPVSGTVLTNQEMHLNVSLVESIKEWKGKVAASRLAKAVSMLSVADMSEMDSYLSELVELLPKARADFDIIPHLMALPCLHVDISIKRKVLSCLGILAAMSSKHKELIVEENGVSLALECLGDDDVGIRAQGVRLLLELSREHELCERVGKAKSCIPLLVASAISGDTLVASMAEDTLSNLSAVMENLVCICETNYFMPLLCKLKNGSLQEKVQMALLLGKTSLTDYSRTSLVQQSVLPLLVQLLSAASPNATPAILAALQNLVTHSDVRVAALETEVVQCLLQILLSREAAKDSVCHELASSILASLAMPTSKNAEAEPDSLAFTSLNILQEKETIHGLIVLLATTDAPPSSKVHLLCILLAVATISNGASKARQEMLDAGAVQLLLTFCDDGDGAVRLYTCRLMNILLEDNGHSLVDILEERHVKNFVTALSDLDPELVMAVLGILSKFPVQDSRVMSLLMRSEAFPKVMEILSREDFRPLRESDRLMESALGVFLLFVNTPFPAALEKLIQFESMTLLVRILNNGRPLARQRAAIALACLSENTMRLSRPAAKSKSFKFLCFGGHATVNICSVHDRICSAEESFCLVKANAIVPLVKALGEQECCVDEAALGALATLLGVDTCGQGIKAIKDAGGLTSIFRILTTGSQQAQERVLTLLERLTSEKEYCSLIGKAEECELILLMQQGSIPTRKLAARILGNAGKISAQSTYF